MTYLAPSTSSLQSIERINQGAPHHESEDSERPSPHTASIHIIDDNSLLNMFYLYRPPMVVGDEDKFESIIVGTNWIRERWWYTLAHVCQRWRNLILGSTSYLDLCLVCTFGTPVADMLAHSLPLPLIINYDGIDDFTAEDEEAIVFALGHRDRVRRIRLAVSPPNLWKVVMAMDEEYPILEYLMIENVDQGTALRLPETFQAPHLRYLLLFGSILPIRSRLLTTAVDLVTLYLVMNHPYAFFQPNTLLHWISFMPQLETLVVDFTSPVPNHDVERQLTRTPIIINATLSNLRWFGFRGVSAYMEAVISRVSTPRLERLDIRLFNQLTFYIPRLQQFMDTADNLKFYAATIEFSDEHANVVVCPRGEVETYALAIDVVCWHLDWQVSSMTQICKEISQILSTVEHLALEHLEPEHGHSSKEHNEVNRTEWCKLLTSFSSVKTLRVDDELVEEISCCLQLDYGEPPLKLLPELQEIRYSRSGKSSDAFASLIDSRQKAGRPVALI